MHFSHRRSSTEYTRLTGEDASFLSFESDCRPMQLGAVAVVSSAGWLLPDGELDGNRLRHLIAERALSIPTLRQTLSRAPITGWPIWLHDSSLDIDLHVRFAEPAANEAEVAERAGDSMLQALDRERPLWRVVVVPGSPGAKTFSLIFQAHHALVDGIAGIDLLALLFDRDRPLPEKATPRRDLSHVRRDELFRIAAAPTVGASCFLNALGAKHRRRDLRRKSVALVRTISRLLTPGPRLNLHAKAGKAERSLTWFELEDRPLRLARGRLGGTPNDLVLAAVARAVDETNGGARRHVLRWRAAVPVSFRRRSERYAAGNRIGLQLVRLDSAGGSISRSVRRIERQTGRQASGGDAEGYAVLTDLTAWTGQRSQRLLHWIAATVHSYAVLVTNVPGPSRPYTFGGATLEAIYPLVPLFGGQALSVGVVRYAGRLRVGVMSAYGQEALQRFALNLRHAFQEITTAVVEDPAEAPLPFPAAEAPSTP